MTEIALARRYLQFSKSEVFLKSTTLPALPNHYGGFRLDTPAGFFAKRDVRG